MTQKAFDAAGFIQVDLKAGAILTPGAKNMALVPFDLFDAIAATDALKQAALEWGEARGRVFSQIPEHKDMGMEVLAQHLQGEIALIGAGSTRFEVIGDALLVHVSCSTGTPDALAKILEGYIAGYLSAVAGMAFYSFASKDESRELSVFVGNSAAVNTVKQQVTEGVSFLDAITQYIEEVA